MKKITPIKKFFFIVSVVTSIIFFLTYRSLHVKNGDEKVNPTNQIVAITTIPSGATSVPDTASSEATLGSKTDNSPGRVRGKVIGVRDGDTIEVDLGNGEYKTVRYIGIDTPESVDPRRTVECFGKDASNMNISLVMNKTVELEKDVSETDRYGRLLRYVYVDTIFVNQYLVEEGFAHASSYPPDIKYQEDLDSSEVEARAQNKGLWAACGGSPENKSKSNSISDKDCPDFATQQEAQDYFISKGGSSSNNVDKLDGSDRDGIVCETLP
jgi:micrococcal nuclease